MYFYCCKNNLYVIDLILDSQAPKEFKIFKFLENWSNKYLLEI